jgi:hypothetical protein
MLITAGSVYAGLMNACDDLNGGLYYGKIVVGRKLSS